MTNPPTLKISTISGYTFIIDDQPKNFREKEHYFRISITEFQKENFPKHIQDRLNYEKPRENKWSILNIKLNIIKHFEELAIQEFAEQQGLTKEDLLKSKELKERLDEFVDERLNKYSKEIMTLVHNDQQLIQRNINQGCLDENNSITMVLQPKPKTDQPISIEEMMSFRKSNKRNRKRNV
jgi:hypothetical protein